jgi:hypothetical protein
LGDRNHWNKRRRLLTPLRLLLLRVVLIDNDWSRRLNNDCSWGLLLLTREILLTAGFKYVFLSKMKIKKVV